MPLNNKISQLKPEFQPIAQWIINVAKDMGVHLEINETLRTDDVQAAYYAQGRQPTLKVNSLRTQAGLYPITDQENKGIITNVMHVSKVKGHGAGLAFDVVPDGDWDAPESKWNVIGQAVEKANKYWLATLINMGAEIIWGGNWVLQGGGHDQPHIELVYKK